MSDQTATGALPGEPTIEGLANPFQRYFLATRPAFLSVSLVGCLIGLANAHYLGQALNAATAIISILGALLIHASINVLNDYYDSLNGTDAVNTDRVFPFTGGSRFIQNGVLTEAQTRRYGFVLLASGIGIGLLLAYQSGPALLWIGLAGVVIGWAYSAPPLKLVSRGFGEFCIALGFGYLIPIGSDFVQRGEVDWHLLLTALPYGLLVTNILYINQFPDRTADAAAGKRHWVVRLGAHRARWVYVSLLVVAFAALTTAVVIDYLPLPALGSLLPIALAGKAGLVLLREAEAPSQRLTTPIKITIAAAVGHGLLLALALWMAA